MKDQQKSELLKGLLAVLPEDDYCGTKKMGGKSWDCNTDCAERFVCGVFNYNLALSAVRTRLEAWVGGLELDVDKIEKIINDVSENQVKPYLVIEWKEGKSIAKSFGQFFAKALASKGSLLIKVRGRRNEENT